MFRLYIIDKIAQICQNSVLFMTNMRNLENRQLETNVLEKIRPIGDFVAEQMPGLIACVREGGAAEEVLLPAVLDALNGMDVFEIRSLDVASKKVALLDLCMMQSALLTHGVEVPGNLKRFIDDIAGDFAAPSKLIYQLYFLENPAADPRTFYNGEIGEHEAVFQREHLKLETKCFKPVVDALMKAADGRYVDHDDAEVVRSATATLRSGSRGLAQIVRSFPPEAFRAFVKYLDGTGVRFSASFPTIDALLLNDLPNYPADQELMSNHQLAGDYYTTTDDLHRALNLRFWHGSLSGNRRRWGALSADSAEALLDFAKQYRAFRAGHMRGAVRKFVSKEAATVPEKLISKIRRGQKLAGVVMDDSPKNLERSGTGGVKNIPVFLMDFIARLDDTIAVLEGELKRQNDLDKPFLWCDKRRYFDLMMIRYALLVGWVLVPKFVGVVEDSMKDEVKKPTVEEVRKD